MSIFKSTPRAKGFDTMLEFATNDQARNAIANAHKERGKILGEVWRWVTRQQ